MTPIRLVFFGTAELACASLAALAGRDSYRIAAVVTQPDRPKGRELKLQPSPVKQEAQRLQLLVLQPERARHPQFVEQLTQLGPELIIVAAYGQILPPAILELPRLGCLNVHTSLLPLYRGAAPIQWAILDGQSQTGVTLMKMDAGLDTGDILSQEAVAIHPSDNAQALHDRLAELGAELLVRTIPDYVAGKIIPRKQPETGASYARKITKEDGRLDWHRPARSLWNQVRAFTPWPGAFTFLPGVTRQPLLKVWEAAIAEASSPRPGEILSADKEGLVVSCDSQSLRILRLQREGGRKMSVMEFLAGFPLQVGQVLSSS